MPILMLINLKGGVAKTTSAVATAECLACRGHKTLLIDADHQCMAGELLLQEQGQLAAERRRQTLYDLLAAMLDDDFNPDGFPSYVAAKASDIGGGLSKLSVIPCSIRMDDFSTNMAKAKRGYRSNDEFLEVFRRRQKRLRRWLKENYDYTVIDCPPSMALQVKVLLSVADAYIIPSVPDRLSVRGSLHLVNRIRSHSYKIQGLGTLWSLYRAQNALHRRVIDQAGKRLGHLAELPLPFETVIPNATKIAEATEPGQQPKTFRLKYTPEFAQHFEKLCDEINRRVGCLAQAAQVGALAEAHA